MKKDFVKCAAWMQEFLQNQVVLRSIVGPWKGKYQVNLYSLDETGGLLCFKYSYPAKDAFLITPTRGRGLANQLRNLFIDWQRLNLDVWASDSQAEVCELTGFSTAPINAYSLDMMFAYQRLLACLETHPDMPGTTIDDVITAHKRLKGFLDQQSKKISQALESLQILANK